MQEVTKYKNYKSWFASIKQKIKTSQLQVAVRVNYQLLELYWDLAKEIVAKQQEANWGDSVLEQLAIDLKLNFPDMNGFSRRNLYAIKGNETVTNCNQLKLEAEYSKQRFTRCR
jgi:hypothetical protein